MNVFGDLKRTLTTDKEMQFEVCPANFLFFFSPVFLQLKFRNSNIYPWMLEVYDLPFDFDIIKD